MAQIILDSNNNLIQGDFDAATVNNRTKLQTSTTNATTGVYVVPNGSATSASVQMANAADPTNASKIVVATNGSTDTQIVSGANGTGTYLPLSFYTNNDIRFQMGTAGELNVRTAPGTVSAGTSGQVLTSGGPGAGVTWATAPSGFTNMQVFASPGTFTTPSTTTKIKVTVVGGGGGGGSGGFPSGSGAGGGGGGTAIKIFSVSASTGYSYTVGAGGSGGPWPGNAGSTGGTSSFGPVGGVTVSATGGAGGTGGGSGAAGVLGGIGSNGDINAAGSLGTYTTGGPSSLGAGGYANAASGTIAQGRAYGGGAGGITINSPTFPTANFTGAAGVVIVEY